MASFTKLLSSVMVALVYASAASATPWLASSKYATHRTHTVGPDARIQLEALHPESIFETFGVEGVDHPLSRRDGPFDIKDASVSFLTSKLGVSKDSVNFRISAEAQASRHAFLRQQIRGVPFANAAANVAFNEAGKVVSFSSSFTNPTKAASSDPTVSLDDAITTAERALGGSFNGHPATLEFLAQPDGSAALTHVVQIQNETTGAWFEAFVDAHTNELLSVTDFVARASYRVLSINKEYPTQGFQVLTDPQDLSASPNGWHSDGKTTTTTTAGNNAIAFKGSQSGVTKQSSSGLNFIYTENGNAAPTTAANVAAAVTNAFYVVNTIHDVSYKYGFTEATFNFQNNNFGKSGKGNDRVTISVQDFASTDNADFSTPADGQSGAMRMFPWDLTNPERDGALENDIVSHDNTHGITNRMTGGGTGRCLQTTEAGGMGEGWSDTMANWLEQGATTQDFVMGQYVNGGPGIRKFPYSTSAKTKPLRYSSIKTLNEVHDIGEIWANTLHNVYAALVQAHGWSATAHTDPTTSEGNADANRFDGANKCILWRAFASRGLGVKAANHNDDSSVPAGC
ncbi:Fungalysin metallopeptidase-domain-containing protein [Gloeopeniophorella convolvens]|nr:Fungalysin metallopeptidase-domain-containing protein [Gloeopeniophorella convolvens]